MYEIPATLVWPADGPLVAMVQKRPESMKNITAINE